MKKLYMIIMLILLTTSVFAQEEGMKKSGITPDSPLYGLDRAMESLRLALTFNSEKEANLHLEYAEERLAEIQKMIEENKAQYVTKLELARQKSLNKSNEYMEKAKEKGRDVSELALKVQEATSKHLAILDGLLEKVPEQAREHIQNAIERSSMNKAVESITKEKPVVGEGNKPEDKGADVQSENNDMTDDKKSDVASGKYGEDVDGKGAGEDAGKGKLVMQITDKKPEVLNITSLEVTIADIKVHIAGLGGTIQEICTDENITFEVCGNESVSDIITTCVNETISEELCTNVTINVTINGTNTTEIEETCENVTSIEEVCTDEDVNITIEVCINETETVETCSDEEEGGDGWFTIARGPVTYDLIELKNVKELLGEKELTAGKYTQIRLSIEDAKLVIGDDEKTLKIPSGRIKLVKTFNIVDGGVTILTLDFVPEESVHQAGTGYIMKPTIKVIQE